MLQYITCVTVWLVSAPLAKALLTCISTRKALRRRISTWKALRTSICRWKALRRRLYMWYLKMFCSTQAELSCNVACTFILIQENVACLYIDRGKIGPMQHSVNVIATSSQKLYLCAYEHLKFDHHENVLQSYPAMSHVFILIQEESDQCNTALMWLPPPRKRQSLSEEKSRDTSYFRWRARWRSSVMR